MTDNPGATTEPPVADAQDPLPESNWKWRRIFIFGLCLILLAGLGWYTNTISKQAMTGNIKAIEGLIDLLRWADQLIGVLILFYLVAPSAEQVVKMLATLAAWRSGISTTSTSRATDASGAVAESTKSAGPAAPSAPAPPATITYGGPPTEDIPPVPDHVPPEPEFPK